MLIVIDIETTGVDLEDRILSLGVINIDKKEYRYEVVNEGKKVSTKASSVHQITNDERKEAVSFDMSQINQYLQEYNTTENILVAHNLDFTLMMLQRSGFVWLGETISTQRVTKHLVSECEEFSLAFLHYELQLYKQLQEEYALFGIKDALHMHNALGDAVIVKLLFDYHNELQSIESLIDLTQKNVLLTQFDFGKYKGKFIEEIAYNDKNYLEWAFFNMHDLDEDMKYTLEYYLQGVS